MQGTQRTFKPLPKALALLDGVLSGTGPVLSLREAYMQITGDRKLTGRVGDINPALLAETCDLRMTEAVNAATFGNVLGTAITRRMVEEYRRGSVYAVWKKIAKTVPIDNFRTQYRVRWGGYGDLPAVAEGEPYAALQSPADEAASYAVTKRGGTEEITLEAIRNDDVQAFRRLPKRLADAAHRTLSKFVLGFLEGNAAIYDGVALFHATHGNLGNATLSAVSVEAGKVAMRKQREPGSNDPMGLLPRFLLASFDQEEAANNLFRRGTNQDRTFLQANPLEVLPVWYWTDANDWCLVADPADCPTIEVGLLDGNEEPELFLQDMPTAGSLFSHDKLTFKIRHAYGGAVVDYRGLYKSVNA